MVQHHSQPRHKNEVSVVVDTRSVFISDDSPWGKILQQIDQIRSNFQVLLAPGEKQFKDLPKRVRLMVVALGIPFLYALLKAYLLPENLSFVWVLMVSLGLGALTYVSMIWGLKGQVRRESYWSVLLLPSVLVVANSLFLSTVFVGGINRVYLWGFFTGAIFMFMTLLYILALAVNILNVTLFYTIPLSRLGESVAYISSIVTIFLLSYTAFDRLVPLIVAQKYDILSVVSVIFGILVSLVVVSLWHYFVPQGKRFWIFVALSSLFTVLLMYFAVLISPFAWVAGILASLGAYVFIGYVVHKEQNTLNFTTKIELAAVSALFLLIGMVV